MRALGKADYGATTFCASTFSNDECGANGLPLTPNSIKILGRFQYLKTLDHHNLCRYVDLVRCKHERVIVVSEHYTNNLSARVSHKSFRSPAALITLAHELISALDFLHGQHLTVKNLCPQNVLIDREGHVKLSKYGLYHMTLYGVAVPFPIGVPVYSSPEVLAAAPSPSVTNDKERQHRAHQDYGTGLAEEDETLDAAHRRVAPAGGKGDVWSVGVMLLQTALGISLWPHLSLPQIIHKITDMAKSELHPCEIIAQENKGMELLKTLPSEIVELIRSCLTVDLENRPTTHQLLCHPVFSTLKLPEVHQEANRSSGHVFDMFSVSLRCKNLTVQPYDDAAKTQATTSTQMVEEEDHLGGRSMNEVYYLWQLAGGDLDATLKRAGLIKSKPPVMNLSSFTLDNGEQFGQSKDRSVLLDDRVVILSQVQLRQRLKGIDPCSFYPLLEENHQSASNMPHSPSAVDLSEISKLPLVIREKDVEYQFHRIILFERLLRAYPYKRQHIWKEARIDIPPLVRPHVWAALLEIEGDVYGRYNAIDKESPTPTDRQIEVDVPRCHQYNDLFSSPEGHLKFRRILKAWVVSHPEYVYWQGLDSLCAPFLYLNFNDEAVAFACLDAFIPKYLHKFFLKDNSAVIQEYLAVFSHLITFHDTELSHHLNSIGFIPDLYSIPWFLTMYAHVFPLHKIMHLWDTLLLGSSSIPLFIGVAILQQLRTQLLSFGFNDCILLFSDMPEIDIHRCMQDSIRLFCTTPKSATFRQHARMHPSRNSSMTSTQASVQSCSANCSTTSVLPSLTDLFKDPLPLAALKEEMCPRISADDVIDLCDCVTSNCSPAKRPRSSKPKVLVVDVRSKEEYLRGTVPGAVNIPFLSAFGADGKLHMSGPGLDALHRSRLLVKVIISSRMPHAVTFGSKLVETGFNRVCVLHNGIESIRSTGVLTVPTPQL